MRRQEWTVACTSRATLARSGRPIGVPTTMPMTSPNTSPCAQPVRRCRVAGRRLQAGASGVSLATGRGARTHTIPAIGVTRR